METTPHSARGHQELGGSTAHIWTNCTGAPFLWRDVLPEPPGPRALFGTHTHECADILLTDFLNHKIHGTDPDIRAHLLCDGEAYEIAEGYRDIVWKEVLQETITGKVYAIEDFLFLDRQLQMGGSADFWVAFRDTRAKLGAHIVDLKTGIHFVDVKKNVQLAFYAACLQAELSRHGKELDYVHASIYQPKALGNEPHFRTTTFTSSQLKTWKKRFFTAAKKIYVDQKPKFKVGDWCQWCRGKGACTAFSKDLSNKTSLALIEPDKMELPKVETLPDETIVQLVLHEEMLVSFLKSAKAYAFSRIRNGRSLPGLKVVETNGRRKWDETRAEELANFLTCFNIEPFKRSLRGITELEREAKGQGVELSTFITKSAPALALVPESDPRNSIESALSVLDVVPVE